MTVNHCHCNAGKYVPLLSMLLLCVFENVVAEKSELRLVNVLKTRRPQDVWHREVHHAKVIDSDEKVGVCQGLPGDSTVRITVSSNNSRTLIDTTRLTWVQSQVQCTGKAPKPMHGRCDDEAIRAAWKCESIDFSKVNTPNFRAMVDPILKRCEAKPSAPPSVLWLGLGGGTQPSYLKSKCPGIDVITVEKNQNVVTVAKNFFAFSGKVMVQDMHAALKDLARKGQRFDAVVSDVGHGVVLGKEGMKSASALLNPNGMVLEKTGASDLEQEQRMFNDFLGHVNQINLPKKDDSRQRNFVLVGLKGT
eukprot:gnl/MRDRNA2_/MRDRNA2_124913_c0_seq1.p1 gnl/MRDRNA2_/MRDRNA2_124913_c0~~gnl/MRDRNA2_/MRDRNA2_124913_c0_seq1.p1  ORF type:complete len:306 (+),score=70.05 gnl/MRDRNA2_/MRDRNA2_124913_c0_seq1:118-1035(+)